MRTDICVCVVYDFCSVRSRMVDRYRFFVCTHPSFRAPPLVPLLASLPIQPMRIGYSRSSCERAVYQGQTFGAIGRAIALPIGEHEPNDLSERLSNHDYATRRGSEQSKHHAADFSLGYVPLPHMNAPL